VSINLSAARRPQRAAGLPERVATEVLTFAQKVRAESDAAVVAEATAIITSGELGTSLDSILTRLDSIEAELP
jgi:hypothetical protein